MKKILLLALTLLVFSGLAQAQKTAVTVHTTGGGQTESVLGPTGAIYFTAEGEQIAIKEETGLIRGYGLGMVEKVTFSEKASEPEGISETESQPIVAYPNPTGDYLRLSGASGPVEIIDLQGRVVLNSTLHSPLSTLALRSLPQGVYFLRCNGQTLKIVKQ